MRSSLDDLFCGFSEGGDIPNLRSQLSQDEETPNGCWILTMLQELS